MSAQRNNLGLDLVRSLAIAAVLFSHTAPWWMGTGVQTDIVAAWVGGTGVHVFFSLSGFLIGTILLREMEGGLGASALGRFWARRWMRTLPAYWVLILVLGWWWGVSDWRSLLFLQNGVPRTQWTPMTPHTWSLVLEEWFYLLVPLLLAGLAALTRSRWAMPLACLVLLVGCFTARVLVGQAPSPVWGPEPFINPILRLDCAAWGLLAAWTVFRRPLPVAVSVVLLVGGVVLLALMGRVWVLMFDPARLVSWGVAHWGGQWPNIYITVEEAAAACVVLGLHRLLPRGPAPLARSLGAMAALSYSLYLVHVPVLFGSRIAGIDDATSWLARAEMAALILGVALLLRFGVEIPVLSLRDRFVRVRPVPGPRTV